MSGNTTIARPYAKAIFELAQDQNSKDPASFEKWSSMLSFASEIAKDKRVVKLMKDPQFSVEDQIEFFLNIDKDFFSEEAKTFISILGEFKRLPVLPEISTVYEGMRAEAERTLKVELISAFPTSEKDQQRFEQALQRRLNCKIQLENSVDKSILGGAIIRAGDLVIDGSIRGKLLKLSEAMGIY